MIFELNKLITCRLSVGDEHFASITVERLTDTMVDMHIQFLKCSPKRFKIFLQHWEYLLGVLREDGVSELCTLTDKVGDAKFLKFLRCLNVDAVRITCVDGYNLLSVYKEI